MKTHPFDRFRSRRHDGFTLVEIAVVLLIVGIIIGMAAVITRGISAAQKRSLTATRMAAVDIALVQFVQQKKRLPCPADGALISSHADAGLEKPNDGSGACDNMATGVVPWRTLGLSEPDATDGWDRRLTYRVPLNLTASNAMDMSWCDPASSNDPAVAVAACDTNCTSADLALCTPPRSFLINKGLRVGSVAGAIMMDPSADPPTGAAYVVISHGESGGGGYLNTGLRATSNTTDGTEEENRNYADRPFPLPYASTHYVDDSLNENPGPGHFDDIVSRPSILNVVTKAGLGPRAH